MEKLSRMKCDSGDRDPRKGRALNPDAFVMSKDGNGCEIFEPQTTPPFYAIESELECQSLNGNNQGGWDFIRARALGEDLGFEEEEGQGFQKGKGFGIKERDGGGGVGGKTGREKRWVSVVAVGDGGGCRRRQGGFGIVWLGRGRNG
ncbi:hypothetical protein MRB53_011945 [Persea americana]|uniref:Uncharacterized protein n=1 Tax=Persea americana TaxID=3435 RepID=A0ACC2LWT3_PERAE|nr:hypothetical protein MRB53_011945 [Persea americana]